MLVSEKTIICAPPSRLTDVFTSTETRFQNSRTHAFGKLKYDYSRGTVGPQSLNDFELLSVDRDIFTALAETLRFVSNCSSDYGAVDELLCKTPGSHPFYEEILFYAGLASLQKQNLDRSAQLFHDAQSGFEKKDIHRGVISSLMNYFLAKQEENDFSVINEYQFVRQKAHDHGLHLSEAGACCAIADLYDQQGALEEAITYTEKAAEVSLLENGAVTYYAAILQKSYLQARLGQQENAERTRQKAAVAPFERVRKDSLVVHAMIMKDKSLLPDMAEVSSYWQDRAQRFFTTSSTEKKPRLSRTQEQLLRLLVRGPMHRFEIIEDIYGKELPLEVTENRLKNVLNRLRQKYPHLLACNEGHYSIKNKSLLDELI